MATCDGVDYQFSKRVDSDEEFEAFLEKQEAAGNRVSKSDLTHVGQYLTGFWSYEDRKPAAPRRTR